jgi:hypothetical protein
MRIWQILFRRRGNPKLRASAVKHPAIGGFHTVVTGAGVSVTFNRTDSTYIFYWLADNDVIARPAPLFHSLASNTRDAILGITLLMKFKIWRSKLR